MQLAVNVRLPPPAGSDGGDAPIAQLNAAPTGTVADAVSEPAELPTVTENVDVLLMLVVTTGVVWPVAPGPDHA